MHSPKLQQAPESFQVAPVEAAAVRQGVRPHGEATRICIRRLNQLREGELAAAAAYHAFLSQHGDEGDLAIRLGSELESHRARAERLAKLVMEMGGQLQSEAGTWGFFETMAEPMAMTGSETMALALLEEGERFGVHEYQAAIHRLERHERDIIEAELLPKQLRSFHAVSQLLAELRRQRNLGLS